MNTILKEIAITRITNMKNYVGYYYNRPYHIRNATIKEKLDQLSLDGLLIEFINNPTKQMKWIAIRSNIWAFEKINNPTDEMIKYCYCFSVKNLNHTRWRHDWDGDNIRSEYCFKDLKHDLILQVQPKSNKPFKSNFKHQQRIPKNLIKMKYR
jgi:hypothetical protein